MGGVRPPFNMLRACFLLLACVIAAQVIATLGGSATCFIMILTAQAKMGDCASFGEQARSIWAEILATVLALLLAARNGKPPEGG